MPNEKLILIYDRGLSDGQAYLDKAKFAEILKEAGENEIAIRDRYDAVFHLETAAKDPSNGAYTLDNNEARTETAEEACRIDDALIAAWTGHPHFRLIRNETEFGDKMQHLLREINSFLGEPEPYEIERKYLIEIPDLRYLDQISNCRKVDIVQTYLVSEPGVESRVRQRGENGHYIYFRTDKRNISDLKRIETEKRLSQEDYLRLLNQADTSAHPIRKQRYCLSENGLYYEIDIYPFWQDKAILEIELASEEDEVIFPSFLRVIREVTDDKTYSNYALAHAYDVGKL